MNANDMPLLQALLAHRGQGRVSFHVPGHKSGRGVLPEAELFETIMGIDMTEITGLDDLHRPEGVIRDAQRLAAQAFGAEETFFLVNGSTAGNLAAILSVCGRDDVILVQRNAHKSVVNGLMLSGARAVFLDPRYDPETGAATGVRPEQVREALRRYPAAKAVFITNPNYYGMGVDVAQLAQIAHDSGKPLIVDEAHGAHYGFHPALPPSALREGADLVIQSTHKMATAMTMGAMLHVSGGRIDRELLRQRLSMVQSSSPSYPIMASLDAGRRLLQTEGRERLEKGLRTLEHLERGMAKQSRFAIVSRQPKPAYETKDPFKVILSDRTRGLDGFKLQRLLEEKGLMVELADPNQVLLVYSLASSMEDSERLLHALNGMPDNTASHDEPHRLRLQTIGGSAGGISEPVRFGMEKPPETVKLNLREAVGRRAGEMVIPYPPGIPVLYPGETISAETAAYLEELAQSGARFQGTADPQLRMISVYA